MSEWINASFFFIAWAVAIILPGTILYWVGKRGFRHWSLKLIPWMILFSGIALAIHSSTDISLNIGGVLFAVYVLVPASISAFIGIALWKPR